MMPWAIAQAQMVLPAHMIISLGGGGGISTIYSNVDTLSATALPSSAVRFAFDYALSTRWSIGGHYDRIGSVRHEGGVDRLRYTTYMLEGVYRPHNGERAAVEAILAAGFSFTTIRPEESLLPLESHGPVLNIGLRYLHMVGGSAGAFVAVEHIHSTPQRVSVPHGPAEVVPDGPLDLQWHAQRITGGMFVRF